MMSFSIDWWLKRRLRELGLVDIPVMKICGLMSTSGKEDVMSNFCRCHECFGVQMQCN